MRSSILSKERKQVLDKVKPPPFISITLGLGYVDRYVTAKTTNNAPTSEREPLQALQLGLVR